MGYMRHHAVVVTTYDATLASVARNKALELFEAAQVSPICSPECNGYHSFFVAPDGSKDGWERSETGDTARAAFLAWLNEQRYGDNSSPHDWVEVQYGDDDRVTKIVNSSDDDRRRLDRERPQ